MLLKQSKETEALIETEKKKKTDSSELYINSYNWAE